MNCIIFCATLCVYCCYVLLLLCVFRSINCRSSFAKKYHRRNYPTFTLASSEVSVISTGIWSSVRPEDRLKHFKKLPWNFIDVYDLFLSRKQVRTLYIVKCNVPNMYIPYNVHYTIYAYVPVYNPNQVHTALYSPIQGYTTLYSHIHAYTGILNPILPYTSLYSPIQPYTALYCPI